MRDQSPPPDLQPLVDPHQTPSGIVVSGRAFDELVKSKAKEMAAKQDDQNESSLFSRYGWNMIGHGAREKPQGTPHFQMLYEAADKSFVDKILIKARVNQMKMIWQRAVHGKQLGFKVVHDRHDDPDFNSNTDQIKERCREMEDLISNPTPVKHLPLFPHQVRIHDGIKNLISVLTSTELIIDRKVMQRYKRADGKGYAAFHFLPGETIKNVDEASRQWARENEPAGKVRRDTMSRMAYATGFDVENSAYVQMIDGLITAAFKEDEISVHIANPSGRLNHWGYGASALEQSLEVTAMLLYAFKYNEGIFKTNYPESILTVAGDYDEAGLRAFKEQLLEEGGGVNNNWRLPVISAHGVDAKEKFEVTSHKLRDTPKDMLFDTMVRFMVLFKCSAYGTHPSTINFSSDSGSGGSLFARGGSEAEMDMAKDHGLRPAILDLCEWFTNDLIKPRYDDLKLIIQGLDKEDEKQVVELRSQRVAKWLTRNEMRQEEGLEPIGDPKDQTNPWNMPADAPMSTYLSTLNMMEQPGAEADAVDFGAVEEESGADTGKAGAEERQQQRGAPPGTEEKPPAAGGAPAKLLKSDRFLTVRLVEE